MIDAEKETAGTLAKYSFFAKPNRWQRKPKEKKKIKQRKNYDEMELSYTKTT